MAVKKMPKTTLIILGVIILVAGAATVFISAGNKNEEKAEIKTEVNSVSVIYTSPETNDTISVSYLEEKVWLNGIGYHEVEFRPIVSASGAKYESQKENLILWSKGNEVTLSRGRKTIFVGTDANSVSSSVPPPAEVLEVLPTTEVAEVGTTTEPAIATSSNSDEVGE